jgi:hypothetical protein
VALSEPVVLLAEPFEALLEPLLQEPPMDQAYPEPQEASVPVDRPLMSALVRLGLPHPAQPQEAWAGITYQHLQP